MISAQTRFAFVARENRCAPATSAGQAFSGSCSSGKDAGPSSQGRRFESGRELQQARRQVGPRHGILIPASAGSNPAALTNAHRGASAGKGPALIRPERRIRPPHPRPSFEASTLPDFVYQLRRSVVDRENAGQHRESGPTSFRFDFLHGSEAQVDERRPPKPKAAGSRPALLPVSVIRAASPTAEGSDSPRT
jgi:hypothetical protein